MKVVIVAAGLLAVAGAGFAEDQVVKFATVMKRSGGGPKKAVEVVIRSEKEWKAFVDTVASEPHRALLSKEKFDFNKQVVVAIARGPSQSVAGKEDGITKVCLVGDKAVVEWTVVESDQRESENSYPFHVIRMPKVKEITFKKTEKSVGG